MASASDQESAPIAATSQQSVQQPSQTPLSVIDTANDTTPDMTKTLLATASSYLQVFKSLDPSVIDPIQTDDYIQTFAPSSLDPPGPLDKSGFAAHLLHLREILQSFPVYAKRMWPNPTERQVLVWADSETKFHESVVNAGAGQDTFGDREGDASRWSYRGEYMFLLSMDESGTKISHVLEFLDSKGTETLRGTMLEARERLKTI